MGWREIMAGPGNIAADETVQAPDNGSERVKATGKANRLAVTALICACIVPFLVGGILATVFGMVALDEIDESDGVERGRGMAQWAIGLGFVNIAVSCAAIVIVILVLKAS